MTALSNVLSIKGIQSIISYDLFSLGSRKCLEAIYQRPVDSFATSRNCSSSSDTSCLLNSKQHHSFLNKGRHADYVQCNLIHKRLNRSLGCSGTRSYVAHKHAEIVPDLQRFLNEIGTDPKEVRYWLKQFQNIESNKPFSVIELEPEVFLDPVQLGHFASAISFLQRNSLRPIIVFGHSSCSSSPPEIPLKELQALSVANSCTLCNLLESQGVHTRVLYSGSNIIEAVPTHRYGSIKDINTELINWCLMQQTIPIIPCFGQTDTGLVMPLRPWEVISAIAVRLHPLKVIKVNRKGGFLDENQQVVINISVPFSLQSLMDKSWCTQNVLDTIQEVSKLLYQMPERTSLVITAADKVLQELFSHRGSGTFFKLTEPVHRYHSLDGIDHEKFTALLNRSFQKNLAETYFTDIKKYVHTIYLSERYTAAAVVRMIDGCDIPYLCKFAVSTQAQGEGMGEILWETIQQDFKQLFWRSRGSNPVNPWYFKKSEGSWSNGTWTVFWYGIPEPSLPTTLIEKAISLPQSFTLPDVIKKQLGSAISENMKA